MTPPTRTRPAPVRLPSRTGQVLGGLAAALGLLAVLAGVPAVLLVVAGSPIPDGIPAWVDVKAALLTRDDGQLFLATLGYLAWACWTLLMLLVLVEAIAQLRGRATPHLTGLGWAQRIAHLLVTGVTAIVLTAPNPTRTTALPPPLPAAATAPVTPATTAPIAPTTNTPTSEPVADHTNTRHPNTGRTTYTVQPRDTLWGIAERLLGDGERYKEIAELNYGRPQPDGDSLTSAHWIRPGWHLALPNDAKNPQPETGRHWYTVQPGDTLRGIAARELGDPDRYHDIARLNHGRSQPDGSRLTDLDLIRPGWKLLLPPAPDNRSKQPPQRPDKPADRDRATTPPTPPPASSPPPTSPGRPSLSPPTPPSPTPATGPATSPTQHTPASTDASTRGEPTEVISLPSGALVSGTLAVAIGAAITLLRLRRRHRYRPLTDPPTAPAGPEDKPTPRRLRRAYLSSLPDDADDEQAAIDHAHARRQGTPTAGATPVAARDGEEIALALPSLGGLGLHGPGADAAARAILTTLFATDSVEIVVTDADLRRLLATDNDATLPTPDTVTVVPTPAAALEQVEAEILHRGRLLETYDVPDLDTLRRDHPGEPVTTLILLTAVPDHAAARLSAALALGRSYHIGAILLGPWPTGTNCQVDADGHLTHTTGPGSDQLTGSRLFHLPPAETTDLLALLTAATSTDGTDTRDHQRADGSEHTTTLTAPEPTTAPTTVDLKVLGPVTISVHDTEISTGLRTKARELLAYLAAHPDGATLDQAITDCWPNTDPDRAANQFRTAIGNIRTTLRQATNLPRGQFVTYTASRYRLDPQTIDVDLWRFTRHLHTTPGNNRIDALTHAIDEYRGDFTHGHGYQWAEPLAESLHRNALDTYTRLAEEHQHHNDTEHAITVLNHAIDLDPHNEDLYQRTIRLLGDLGRTDAIQRLYQQLQNKLTDLDVDTDPNTERLVNDYLTKPRQGSAN